MERKSDIYNIIPQQYYPKTILIETNCSKATIKSQIENSSFIFPLIIKPDIGGKGRGVKKVTNIADAVQYIYTANFPMLVQTLVPYSSEVGIFYYRFPWQKNGHISGIVTKQFMTVVGNGKDTLETLLSHHSRYILQLSALRKMPDVHLKQILAVGQVKIIAAFGNHARGAKFIDDTKKCTPILEKSIDHICKQIPNFYFGRLDIMYECWQHLEEGKNLSIIELNGAGSEPTHIYDPTHSIFFAWKEIIKHLKILYKISVYNHKKKKVPYLTFKAGLKMHKEASFVEKKLDSLF